MTTAVDLITRSGRIAGALGKSEVPDDDESVDGLTALNSMLDSWSIERMMVYYIVQEALTLVASQATYTMGSGGDLDTTRPTQIDDSCFVTLNSIDYPLMLIDGDAYASIVFKAVESNLQYYLFPDYQDPLVNLNFYPTPSQAGTAQIRSWKQLQQFSGLTTVFALPPGHERAIVYNLALEYWETEFGLPIPTRVEKIAINSKANIKRINAPSPIMRSEVGYLNRNRIPGNIRNSY